MLGTELCEKYAHFGAEKVKDLRYTSPGGLDEGGETLNTLGVGRRIPGRSGRTRQWALLSLLPPPSSLPVPQDWMASDFSSPALCPTAHPSASEISLGTPPVLPSSQGGRTLGHHDTRRAIWLGFAAA